MIHRETFLKDYESFWSRLPVAFDKMRDHPRDNADLVALIFVILAMGTQFVPLPSANEKEQSAEFSRSYIPSP